MGCDRPVDAGYLFASVMRKSFDRLAPKRAPPWENAGKLGWNYEVVGGSLAGGQLVFAAFEGRQFDPPANVEGEQEGVNARSIENYPTPTCVAAGQSFGFVA